MNITISVEHLRFFECLGSETRIRIIELLQKQPMNIKDLAEALQLSSAIITKHIQKLEEADIVHTENLAGVRGVQKRCSLRLDEVRLRFMPPEPDSALPPQKDVYTVSIPVGHYTDYEVKPTCGLASADKLIGMVDDPRYFADTERIAAEHLWFAGGYVEYRIPNYLLPTQQPGALRISLELCSEAPNYKEDWPSDITFSLNGTELFTWTCPGDYGSQRGVYTPAWWSDNMTQHGLLKTLLVTKTGSFMDGVRMSDITIDDVSIVPRQAIRFRIASREDARHPGGVSLFGSRFGNYNQDIEVMLSL